MESLAHKVVDEIIGLLRSVDFTLDRDLELPGRLGSAALVLFAPPCEDRTFGLTLRLSGPGHVDVDWSGIGVRLDEIKERERGDRWFKITGRSGRLTFRGKLSKGVSRLNLRASRSTIKIGHFMSAVARPADAGVHRAVLPHYSVSSPDRLLIAEAQMLPGGRIQLAVEGQLPEFSGADVCCELTSGPDLPVRVLDLKMTDTRQGRPFAFHEFPTGVPENTSIRVTAFLL